MTTTTNITDNLTLIGDYDHNNQQALKLAINSIQKKFDLSHQILQEWLDQENFQENLNELDKKCYIKVICQQKHSLLNRLLDVTYPDTFVEDHLFWEKEKCGQIVDEFKNGYIKYCNKHKYLHPDRKNPLKRTKITKPNSLKSSNQDNTLKPPRLTEEQLNPDAKYCDHYFVEKNPKEILDEKIFSMMFNVYVQYSRALANSLENDFYKYLVEQGYSNTYMQLDELTEKKSLQWFQKHQNSFRGKSFVFSSEKPNQQTDEKTEYVKIYLHPKDQKSNPFRSIIETI